jgi:CheY-like chemotaxis protein
VVEAKNHEVELAKRLVEEKAEQLAVSSAFKSDFFSNMSHELRTPLNSLLILAGELKANAEQNLTDAQVQYASIIQSSGADLLRLLNDLLDLAKVESGMMNVEISELSLVELKDAIEREFGPVADHKGISFSVAVADSLPPNFDTDSRRLRQVLKNLLANAFKFTERGEVTLHVGRPDTSWRASNGKLGQADRVTAFSIRDTGIGIAPGLQERIFEAFSQADGSTARQYGGTGLGLSISRELVALLGGEISITSTLGEGTTVTVYLPSARHGDVVALLPLEPLPPAPPSSLGRAPKAPALLSAAPPERPVSTELAHMKVLVVDDDFRNIFAITVLLERCNLVVVSAESGAAGLELLEQTPDIDIVLIDIMMPVMDGYETIRAMRKMPWPGRLAIVALTAKTSLGERERCIAAGAWGYIAKPVENGPDFLAELGDCLTAGATSNANG